MAATSLIWASVQPLTQRRYLKAPDEFLVWMQATYDSPRAVTPQRLDKYVVLYIQHKYETDPSRGNRQHCINLKCAIHVTLPETVNQLLGSQRALSGWDKLVHARQKPPISYGFTLFLVDYFMREHEIEAACAVMLAFDMFMRINELLSICHEDVSLPQNQTPGGIRLRQTKRGRNQSVLLRHPLAVCALRTLMTHNASQEKIFSISPGKFFRMLQQARVSLGLSDEARFTAHSFRHGGASHWFLMGASISDIAERGRWASEKTCKTYVQTGRALLFSTLLPPNVKALSDALTTRPLILLSHFPVTPELTLPFPYVLAT
jgi:hypothetical protein